MGAMHSRFGPHFFVTHHRHHGRFRNKLIFLGVTLWLTSTVVAGVRRATGLTHKALVSDETKRRQEYLQLMDTRFQQTRQQLPEQQQQLEQAFVDAASSNSEREERRKWIEKERESMYNGWQTQGIAAGWPERRMCEGRRHSGGFVRWYLGVGERTFDWFVRKIQNSSSFQIDGQDLRRSGSDLGPTSSQ
ncbi:hypothetical protein FB645_001961 [Coemansia sp. IMI 203386]|nr:hypothetical protein FB645_001961 [Coemansia sp. IMI 203386]